MLDYFVVLKNTITFVSVLMLVIKCEHISTKRGNRDGYLSF